MFGVYLDEGLILERQMMRFPNNEVLASPIIEKIQIDVSLWHVATTYVQKVHGLHHQSIIRRAEIKKG
jgi:hypothetical protein